MSGWRVPNGGSVIDRAHPIQFRFDGRPRVGYRGDTLASALLGSGVDLIARSFKFHRPRGVRAGGWEDPNAFVRLQQPIDEANVLATRLPLVDGLEATSQHRWPSLSLDLGALADWFRPLLPAGFYYKTFKWPQRAWPGYEHIIRRAAGLGRLPARESSLQVERRHARFDVLVVGAGLSGAAAALAVVRSGRSLIWVDDQAQPRGRLGAWAEDDRLSTGVSTDSDLPWLEGESAQAWLDRAVIEIDTHVRTTRLSNAVVLGVYEQGEALVLERQRLQTERLWRLQVDRVILATGAFELPILCVDNDRPGVMLAGAAGEYLDRHAVACGRRVVLAGPQPLLHPLAIRLQQVGVDVVALVDPEAASNREGNSGPSGDAGFPVLPGVRVTAVHGRSRVEAVSLQGQNAEDLRGASRLDCDGLFVHGGWSPTRQLLAHAPGAPGRDGTPGWMHVVGAAAGWSSPNECLLDGWRVASGLFRESGGPRSIPSPARVAVSPEVSWAQGRGASRVFVDLASDVSAADIAIAQREGYEAPELLKRYTTLGMGPDQGRGAGPLGVAMMARLRGLDADDLGLTRARPPWVPVAFGTLAGAEPGPLIRPFRETPLSGWHREAGAVMYESGANWRRPGYYPRSGESMAEAVARECLAVRGAVGVYDSTPLGKFEISGQDATAFLERLLPSRVGTLARGRGRYALLLREDGRLLDDGVLFRLDQHRYWLTSTAGNADAVLAWLEYAQQWLFRDLRRVIIAQVSAQWAAIVVCGPQARALLQRLGVNISLEAADFPFMAVRHAQICGLPARVFRVSFTGELSFELNVRPRDAYAIWQRVIEFGREFGIEPIGSEANHVLRIEKGFISIGHEADGYANPDDLGLSWAIHLDKGDFVGRRSIVRDRSDDRPRPQYVGLEVDDGPPLEEGAQIIDAEVQLGQTYTASDDLRSQGFVTASVHSPTLGRSIALAMLDAGRSRIGETVQVTVARPGGPERGHAGLSLRRARVVAPAFYDLKGERLRG